MNAVSDCCDAAAGGWSDIDVLIIIAIILAMMAAASLIGFLTARAHYRKRIEQRVSVYTDEILRLRRQLASHDAKLSRARMEADRSRRRATGARSG